jgi:hypothetical protein
MSQKVLMVGCDVGKRHDPTAISVSLAEQRTNEAGREETHYVIPLLRRLLPLGQPYPQQAEELISIAEAVLGKFRYMPGVDLYGTPYPRFYIDVTGVGDGMVDLLKPRLSDKFHMMPCRFVHGDKLGSASGEYRPGKSWFASRLQVLSEGRLIHISPANPEAEAVANELMDFDINVDETTGIDRYGAMRPGTHDDMVCALGLSCLIDPFYYGG